MGRLPFDPMKMAAEKAAAARAAEERSRAGADRMTVSELAALIEVAVRDHLPRKLKVVGEVSGFKEQGHWYFRLKDAGAVVGCVMWESLARRSGFRPENGQEVVVSGHVEYWGKGGRTQLYVEKIEPVGAGALDLEFKRLVEELRGLGWLAPERKRKVPWFPRRVAVVTSRTGAALQDVLDTMKKRCAAVAVAVIDVRVQGEGAAAEVAGALRWIGRVHGREGIDAVVLTRGGGSKEDLWTFNERVVAQAIVECPVPVVAAIGHETDVTIAELVADERCATPTQAAVRVTPDASALGEQLDGLGGRLSGMLVRAIRHERERLRSAARHPFFTDPGARIADAAADVEELARRMAGAARQHVVAGARRVERADARLERHRPAAVYARWQAEVVRLSAMLRGAVEGRVRRADVGPAAERLARAWRVSAERVGLEVDAAERGLELVGPVSVLRRGFSCTLRADGSVVRSIGDVRAGDAVATRVVDGTFGSVVSGEGTGEGKMVAAAAPSAWRERRRKRKEVRDQMGLFER